MESGSVFPIGETVNRYRVTDDAGHSEECSFSVIVNDNEAPSIQCPSNMMVDTYVGQCSAVVTYDPPIVTDNCVNVTMTQTNVRNTVDYRLLSGYMSVFQSVDLNSTHFGLFFLRFVGFAIQFDLFVSYRE